MRIDKIKRCASWTMDWIREFIRIFNRLSWLKKEIRGSDAIKTQNRKLIPGIVEAHPSESAIIVNYMLQSDHFGDLNHQNYQKTYKTIAFDIIGSK